ncbi:MAG: B12-binding domain-containing radical SAM protein [Deltaproteobacteria bacterium]
MNTIKRKVLMVYPEIPVTYWSFKYALPFIKRKAPFPPLGLLTIAGLMPDNYDIKLIDMNVTKLREKDIQNAELIFISAMIVQKESFQKVVKLCNKLKKPIVAGGPYPTSSYENITGVDYFVLNEGEITLQRFIEDFEKGCAKKIYSDETKPDITFTPPPRYDLINVKKYVSAILQFSRGCPFNCDFCDVIEMFGRTPRAKNPWQFINELETVYQSGFRGSVFIVDDNFIGNKVQVKKLLPEIAKWQKKREYPFTFFTEASVNLANEEELMDLMVEAGFDMVFLGIETPVQECLVEANKGQNIKQDLLESIKIIQKKGMEVSGGFILGFDNDPKNIFDLQINFIQKAGIPMAMVGLLNALPNTKLYKRLKSEGRIIKESSGNNTHDLQLNFIPKMDYKGLIEGYKKVLSAIYLPKNYFDRAWELLKNLPVKKVAYKPVKLKELRALVMSLFRQALSSYGIYYSKFLLKVLILKPKLFNEAVRIAIMGQHFFKITKEMVSIENINMYIEEMTQKPAYDNLEC